jgi:hypothetical protein
MYFGMSFLFHPNVLSLHWLNLYMLEYVCDAICFINEHDILLGLEASFFKLTFGVVRSHSFFLLHHVIPQHILMGYK